MIKTTGYYYNGDKYAAYYKGKHIGDFASRQEAWRAIGVKQWKR